MIDKLGYLTTLYELSLMLYPKDVEDMLKEFVKIIMTRFGFSCAYIEVPLLEIKISIPKKIGNCENRITFERKNFRIMFGRRREIPEKYPKILDSILSKLDQMLEFAILSNARKRLLENNEDVIIFLERNHVVKEMNKKALEILGDLRGKVIDKAWLSDIVKHDGRYYAVSKYDFGFEIGIIAKDVTEKIKLEEKLRKSEKDFKLLVETAPFSILVYKDEKWVYANKEAEKLLGYSKDELIGMPIWNVIHPDYHERAKEIIRKRLSGVPDLVHVSKIVRKDGETRYVLVNGSLIRWNNENAIIITLVDITRQKILEERLRELVENLSLINSILRHDILNNVTSILAYLELYREERNEAYLSKIENSAKRIVDIIKDVRELEEVVRNGKLKEIRLRDLIESIVSCYDAKIEIEGDCLAIADEGLRSVIGNIIDNALKHSKTDKIDIKIREKDDFCEIRIADFGIGIPDEIKDRVFERGFKFGENANTGLGLYIAKKVVERVGGSISVEDNKPRGSVFIIRLKKRAKA